MRGSFKMKLYYFPAACSLASHITAIEAGVNLDLVKVNMKEKTVDGKDFHSVNPKGFIPALELDDGSILTENAVVLQYLASRNPQSGLLPTDEIARFRVLENINFIATEIHKSVSPMMNPALSDAVPVFVENLAKRFTYMESALGDKTYLNGNDFTIADAYLFTTLVWLGHLKMDIAQWPRLQSYYERVSQRPAVSQALKEEGLA